MNTFTEPRPTQRPPEVLGVHRSGQVVISPRLDRSISIRSLSDREEET